MMKAIDLLIRILTFGKNKSFLTDYVTTIKYKVYVPSDWSTFKERDKIIVINHELVHMNQYYRYKTLFFLAYLLFPVPLFFAWARTKFEMEAYEVTLRLTAKRYGIPHIEDVLYRNSIITIFTGPGYGWMMYYRKYVENWYDEVLRKIRQESEVKS